MTREEILESSKKSLSFGQAFLASLQEMQRNSTEADSVLVDELLEKGDEEFIALNEEYLELLDKLEEFI